MHAAIYTECVLRYDYHDCTFPRQLVFNFSCLIDGDQRESSSRAFPPIVAFRAFSSRWSSQLFLPRCHPTLANVSRGGMAYARLERISLVPRRKFADSSFRRTSTFDPEPPAFSAARFSTHIFDTVLLVVNCFFKQVRCSRGLAFIVREGTLTLELPRILPKYRDIKRKKRKRNGEIVKYSKEYTSFYVFYKKLFKCLKIHCFCDIS